jgi:hypothetical protein
MLLFLATALTELMIRRDAVLSPAMHGGGSGGGPVKGRGKKQAADLARSRRSNGEEQDLTELNREPTAGAGDTRRRPVHLHGRAGRWRGA